jgi:hypothetical protein
LKNKGSTLDEIAQKKGSWKVLPQNGMVAGFYFDSKAILP